MGLVCVQLVMQRHASSLTCYSWFYRVRKYTRSQWIMWNNTIWHERCVLCVSQCRLYNETAPKVFRTLTQFACSYNKYNIALGTWVPSPQVLGSLGSRSSGPRVQCLLSPFGRQARCQQKVRTQGRWTHLQAWGAMHIAAVVVGCRKTLVSTGGTNSFIIYIQLQLHDGLGIKLSFHCVC